MGAIRSTVAIWVGKPPPLGQDQAEFWLSRYWGGWVSLKNNDLFPLSVATLSMDDAP